MNGWDRTKKTIVCWCKIRYKLRDIYKTKGIWNGFPLSMYYYWFVCISALQRKQQIGRLLRCHAQPPTSIVAFTAQTTVAGSYAKNDAPIQDRPQISLLNTTKMWHSGYWHVGSSDVAMVDANRREGRFRGPEKAQNMCCLWDVLLKERGARETHTLTFQYL